MDVNGSIIMVTMRLCILVIIFLGIWFGGLIYGFFSGLLKTIRSGEFASVSFEGIAMFLGFLLFGYLLTTVSFKYESLKSKDFLTDLLEADQVIELGLLGTEMNT